MRPSLRGALRRAVAVRSMTWTNEGEVTYWRGYLDATLTGGHRLVGLLRCP